ncbi:Recombination-associated protein RdgC [Desulfovibrionales bacterium]
MGILTTNVTLTRYHIVEAVPDALWTEIPSRLKRFAFKDIDQTVDERSVGWTSFDNMLDTYWHETQPEKGEFLALALRLETRRLSPAIYKKHLQIKQKAAEDELKKSGRKFLSHDQKKELREQVRLQLISRCLPVPAIFDVVWNTKENIVYFSSANSKAISLFTEYFTATFELHLDPLTPYSLTLRLMGEAAQQRLETLEPTNFIT